MVDPIKYYWMRYTETRATNITVNGVSLRFQKGDLFGVKEIRGKPYDDILSIDGTRVKLDIKKSDLLMDRSKEYKGRTPKLVSKNPVTVKQVKKQAPAKTAPVKKVVSKNTRPAASTPKIIISKKLKPKVTKITMSNGVGGAIKLKDVELPSEDDFTDHDLPFEFKDYARVESSFNSVAKILSVSSADFTPGSMHEFNQLIKLHLEPCIRKAKSEVDTAIKQTAMMIKAWAVEHMQMAQKFGKRTDLFEKLVNDPISATRQLASNMMGIKATSPQAEEKKLDDLLDGIQL